MDLIRGPPPIEEDISETAYVSWLRKTLHNLHDYARTQLETSIQVIVKYLDVKVEEKQDNTEIGEGNCTSSTSSTVFW